MRSCDEDRAVAPPPGQPQVTTCDKLVPVTSRYPLYPVRTYFPLDQHPPCA